MIEDLSAHFEEANKWQALSERDKLICRMALEGMGRRRIADQLRAKGFTASDQTIIRVLRQARIENRNKRFNGYRAIQAMTPPKPTVRDPDAYMKRKGVRFEDVRFGRPVHISEVLERVVERVSKSMGE